ncbi:cyclase family protein [soil metagenome]
MSYDELPAAPRGGRSGWGHFGADDQIGSLNRQTPERIAAAARLVRRGAMFPLNAPVDAFGHEHWGRRLMRRETVHVPGGVFFDDLLQDFGPQGSSQWDALGHVGYEPDAFYNGATEEQVASGRNGIDVVARRGIAGRGVLLDMVRSAVAAGNPYDPLAPVAFGVAELEAALALADTKLVPGDILVLRTGFGPAFAAMSADERTARPLEGAGLAHEESVVRWLWDHQLSAIVSDNLAIEAWPIDESAEAFPFGALHNMLIGQLGFSLGELWDLEDLAEDCASTGSHEMLIVSAPLNVPGGHGSPANAIALV